MFKILFMGGEDETRGSVAAACKGVCDPCINCIWILQIFFCKRGPFKFRYL